MKVFFAGGFGPDNVIDRINYLELSDIPYPPVDAQGKLRSPKNGPTDLRKFIPYVENALAAYDINFEF